MRKILIAATMLALAAPVLAQQLYKWVDKDGKTYYSDTPPPNQDSKSIGTSSGVSASVPPAGSAAPAKTAVQRDKELEKGRQEARDAAKKADDSGRMAAARDEQCLRLRAQYQQMVEGGRIHKYNDKGERVIMDDADIERDREKARVDMEDACKKS